MKKTKRLSIEECRDYLKRKFQHDTSYIRKSVHCRTDNDSEHERVIVTCKLNGWTYVLGGMSKDVQKDTGLHLNYYAHFGSSVEMLWVRDTKQKKDSQAK